MSVAAGRPRASISGELPAEFFQPAPLRRRGELTQMAEARFRHSGTASLAFLRVVALGTAISWLVFMILGRLDTGGYTQAWWPVFLLFGAASLGVIAAAVIHRERVYFLAFLSAGGLYCIVLAVHLGFLLITGESPLTETYLGDYTGLPVAMLITALPVRWGMPVAVAILSVAAVVNLGTPLGFNTVLEIANAHLVMLPFLVLLQSGRRASRLLDGVANLARNLAVRVARSQTLAEVESRFLGFLHDRVLTHLDAIKRGVLPADDAALRQTVLESKTDNTATQVAVTEVIANLVAHIPAAAPGIRISLPTHVPELATMPSNSAASLHDAALEAAQNTARHAPGAPAFLDLELEVEGNVCTGMVVTVRDHGPGFDPADIPRNRAGVRVAIAGRMQAAEGCDLNLTSRPGEGTTVALSWRVDGPGAASPEADEVAVPSEYELVGIGRIFRPRNALAAWLAFFGMSLNNTHQYPVLYLLALTAAAVALAAFTRGWQLRLPAGSTAIAAGAVIVFFVSAVVDHGEAAQLWPTRWFPLVFALLCTYLALRGRARVSWLLLVAAMVIAQLLIAAGLNTPDTGPVPIAAASLMLIPATLIPRMVKLTTRGLPLALELSRNEATAMETVSAQTSYLADSTAWVNAQISAALDPELAEPARRRNAELLELRLRDSIRSPLFDDAAVTRAVWDARAGGVTVSLLDDRTAVEGSEVQMRQLHAELILALDQGLTDRPVDRITARILPPGRDHYATVVVSGPDQVRRLIVE